MSARLLRRGVPYGSERPAPGQLRLPRVIPRVKTSWTSLCPSCEISYVLPGRERASTYRFGSDCFCLSPERHAEQFDDDEGSTVHET